MENIDMNQNLWEEIARYLAGEMTENEMSDFLTIIRSSKENNQLFEDAKKDWEIMKPTNQNKSFNVDNAWLKFNNRIENEIPEKVKPIQNKVIKMSTILKMAAIFVGFLMLPLAVLYFDNVPTITVATNGLNEQKVVKLPDGSVVTLNGNSKLTYPEEFTDNKRIVKLEGEAFFDVEHDSMKLFVISAQNAEIAVLGTSFNVNSNYNTNQVSVCVKTGRVQVRSRQKQTEKLIVTAGQMASVKNGTVTKSDLNNENYLAWKTKVLHFNGEKLSEIIAVINQVYSINIVLENQKSGDFIISKTVFEKLPVETVIDLLCATFNLKKEQKSEQIILSEMDAN